MSRKGVRMTNSCGLAYPHAADSTLPTCRSAERFSSTFVGWLIQTAFVAVVQGTCETLSESRGFKAGRTRTAPAGSAFPFNFGQIALIFKAFNRKSKLSSTGYVAGPRRRRRTVPG